MKKPKRPKDTNLLAQKIVGLATGEITETQTEAGKNPAAVALGRLGGLKGGKARAQKLSKARKKKIAQMGAQARWNKKK